LTEYLHDLFCRYQSKGVLIDSNLLLIYFIGKYYQGKLDRYKRTRQYTVADFGLISNIIQFFKRVITTPNILTEVSNLSSQLPERTKEKYFTLFCKEVEIFNEEYLPSIDICKTVPFSKLGLTDMAIFKAAKGKYLVITDDLPLYNILLYNDIDTINLNHIRAQQWLSE